MFIKEKILNNGIDSRIKITLNSSDEFIGVQQEIDNLTKFKSLDLVNPIIDVEKFRFKLNPTIPVTTIQFRFNDIANFLYAGFTENEISGSTRNICNSFFILDYYDTYDLNIQQKIFTTYLTKIGQEPIYNVSSNTSNQFNYWYVPKSYIDENTGNTVIGYVKFSFYNAKTGGITLFYNNDNYGLTTPEKYFFKVELNLLDRTWKFINSNVIAVEQQYTGINNYNNKVDNTFNKLDLLQEMFPTGNSYNYRTNKYLDIK